MGERLLTEIPSSLKQLARLVVRGFYTIEDSLIVDMLVRNPCMKEDDICELLKFEKKMLRARIAMLKNDRFIQVRLRMETGADGKAQKVNYYFINYKTFVNVIKYKLDLMRKRLETEERDATSRASFKCLNCLKTFTDLEADQLYDFVTDEFRCTYCHHLVEEDASAMPKKDSRLLLAKFNEQMDVLYVLLREVEGIKLAPECLEPEPVDIGNLWSGPDHSKNQSGPHGATHWSGEATRSAGGFLVEEARVNVSIESGAGCGTPATVDQLEGVTKKAAPIWMLESTVITAADKMLGLDKDEGGGGGFDGVGGSLLAADGIGATNSKTDEDIMSVLLAHEKKTHQQEAAAAATRHLLSHTRKRKNHSSDSSTDDEDPDRHHILLDRKMSKLSKMENNLIGNNLVTSSSEGEELEEDIDDGAETDGNIPTVTVGSRLYNVTEINDEIIGQMTQSEKEIYVQIFQDYYSHMSY